MVGHSFVTNPLRYLFVRFLLLNKIPNKTQKKEVYFGSHFSELQVHGQLDSKQEHHEGKKKQNKDVEFKESEYRTVSEKKVTGLIHGAQSHKSMTQTHSEVCFTYLCRQIPLTIKVIFHSDHHNSQSFFNLFNRRQNKKKNFNNLCRSDHAVHISLITVTRDPKANKQ